LKKIFFSPTQKNSRLNLEQKTFFSGRQKIQEPFFSGRRRAEKESGAAKVAEYLRCAI
jgi:hypothetical protein